MTQNAGFQGFFDGVRKFHAGVGEELYAIVVVGIVGGGDDHSGLKIILADEAGYAGSSDDSGERDGGAAFGEAGGEKRGDMGAGFASVHADEDVGGAIGFAQIISHGAAGGEEGAVIERRSAGNAANAVGAEELFGHEMGPMMFSGTTAV